MIVETRAYAETQLHEGGWWRPKDIYHGLVWNSLEAGDLEGAANALVHWWDLSDSNSLETNHANRINIQTLVDSTMTFMDAGGGSHPLSAEVVRRAGAISKEALPYLSGFQKAVISRWAAPS